jgi:SPP1 family phage portal protein
MEELIELIKTNPTEAISAIALQNPKKPETIVEYRKEYKEHDRELRDTQVGKIQKDRPVGNTTIKEVRVPINFAKKIVTTAAAFEVGKPVTLIPSEENELSNLIKQIWKVNRMDAMVQKLVTIKKKETQVAIQFYINDLLPTSLFNRIVTKLGLKTQKKEIKTALLENEKGLMYPYFDSNGDMIIFMWKYDIVVGDKTIKNIKIWDKDNMYFFSDELGSLEMVDKYPMPHGFDRIPIVYVSQEEPEWYDVREMIDRLETCISKLGSSNDYIAYPLLMIFGEIKSMPRKEDTSKILNFPIVKDDEGKVHHGKAEFLESEGAGASQKLELEKLEEYIYSISQTPNLSFDNVKSLGNVSGVALKLMFLDAFIKASMNEGENRTMIERMINIIISGIIKTTNTGLSGAAASLFYDVQFNSILPDDLKEAVEIVSNAVNSKVMSRKTAVEYLGMNEDSEEELELIKSDQPIEAKPKTEV